MTVSRIGGHGTITLPADYARNHVQLAYASTEHGAQGDTADRSITLATTATTGRGLYVGMTRGRNENLALVATDTADLAQAISVLEAAIAVDRADIPATTQPRTLAAAVPRPSPRPRVQIPDWFNDLRADADELGRDRTGRRLPARANQRQQRPRRRSFGPQARPQAHRLSLKRRKHSPSSLAAFRVVLRVAPLPERRQLRLMANGVRTTLLTRTIFTTVQEPAY